MRLLGSETVVPAGTRESGCGPKAEYQVYLALSSQEVLHFVVHLGDEPVLTLFRVAQGGRPSRYGQSSSCVGKYSLMKEVTLKVIVLFDTIQ
jgi:hypothetical protein